MIKMIRGNKLHFNVQLCEIEINNTLLFGKVTIYIHLLSEL